MIGSHFRAFSNHCSIKLIISAGLRNRVKSARIIFANPFVSSRLFAQKFVSHETEYLALHRRTNLLFDVSRA